MCTSLTFFLSPQKLVCQSFHENDQYRQYWNKWNKCTAINTNSIWLNLMGVIFGFLLVLYSLPWLYLHIGCSCCPCPCKRHSLQEVRKHFFSWPRPPENEVRNTVLHMARSWCPCKTRSLWQPPRGKKPWRPIFDLIDFVGGDVSVYVVLRNSSEMDTMDTSMYIAAPVSLLGWYWDDQDKEHMIDTKII